MVTGLLATYIGMTIVLAVFTFAWALTEIGSRHKHPFGLSGMEYASVCFACVAAWPLVGLAFCLYGLVLIVKLCKNALGKEFWEH